ncbi:hypothetical protein CNMCM8980_004914 [Aspergillus fumigatiaffinis]|nr:hypothetical protein CNMCM8980_004914 [Aspergillus fumigatiaffinis]
MSLQEMQNLRRHLEEEQRLQEKERQLREQGERSQIQAEEQLKLQTQETTPRNSLMPAMCTYFSGYLSEKTENRRQTAIRPTPPGTHVALTAWRQNSAGLASQHSRHGVVRKLANHRLLDPEQASSVYNKGPEGDVPAFIIEYKAPHKVALAHIRAGLQGMDLDGVLRLQ